MDVNTVFQRLKYRCSKSGYDGAITSSDFNLMFPAAELRYYLKEFGNQNQYQYGSPVPRIAYPGTLKVSTSLSKFGSDPTLLTIDSSGSAPKPDDMFFIDSISHIVTTDGGNIAGAITPGTTYTNGTYANVALTGGSGTGARATIVVAGAVVTSVTFTDNGSGYHINDLLTTPNTNIGGTGSGFIYTIHSVGTNPTPIKRVEKQDLSGNLYSSYEMPTETFPIYVEYDDHIQFYPASLGYATLTYLKKPTQTVWGFTLNGTIATTNTLVGGSGYTNGTYPNVNFTGGSGNSASGTVVVAGGVVTSVVITNGGFVYKVGDTLTGVIPAGTGWSFKVATITNAREVYNSTTSTDPLWSDFDVDELIYMMLQDVGAFLNSPELEAFGVGNSKDGGIAS